MMMNALFPLGWQHYLLGGLLIGLGVSWLFVSTGLIGGVSTFYTSTLSYFSRLKFLQETRFVQSRHWRLIYAAGLIAGAMIFTYLLRNASAATTLPWWQLALGGLVAGFGARMSNGCTSGHGICGMASLQLPSLLAVLIFLATAMITARLVLFMGGQ